MRDFKFRCWYESIKEFLHFENPIAIADGEDRYGMFLKCKEGKIVLGEGKLMQYTGFKDKNSKEVYEGDIVTAWSEGYCGKFEIKFRQDGGGSPMWLLYPAWQNREFWYISASREDDGEIYDRGIEIIGNIYENKNLLEEKE